MSNGVPPDIPIARRTHDTTTDDEEDLFPSFDDTASRILQDILNIDREAQETIYVVDNISLLAPKGNTPQSKLSPEQLQSELWTRKTRDETTVEQLQNDLCFEHWIISFKAKLETSDIDTHTFLNQAWPHVPLSGFKKELYAKQCAFFWTLISHAFKSDLSNKTKVVNIVRLCS
eukprot:jgi/Psemu1/57545/gm1.57545_g